MSTDIPEKCAHTKH